MNDLSANSVPFDASLIPRAAPPGNAAVWVLIYSELTEFALFFLIFFVAKWFHPDVFRQGPLHLNTLAGTLNTLILISSSFFVARATRAIKIGDHPACKRWLWWTISAGAAYCGVKTWEYIWNVNAGIHSSENLFFSIYYYLTFNHLLHVLIGMCVLLWATLRTHFNAYGTDDHEGLEGAAMYWHMIDLAWIVIFPLLYVVR
ncbi:MAG: cytochrome c oxidase subunit 3 family protein [Chromatiales bacterium]|nr:cytochrome c oxidase subunit 3 family protein [Chromatiales bacterium]